MSAIYSSAKRTRSKTMQLRYARKRLVRAIAAAKTRWISEQCRLLNNSFGTKAVWDLISKLKSGLSKTRPAAVKQMKKPDGSKCQSPAENAEVFKMHFESLYGRTSNFDPSVIDLLKQHLVATDCDYAPTDDEIKNAMKKLRDSGPGDSGLCAQAWKCLLKSEEMLRKLLSTIFGRLKMFQTNGKQVF